MPRAWRAEAPRPCAPRASSRRPPPPRRSCRCRTWRRPRRRRSWRWPDSAAGTRPCASPRRPQDAARELAELEAIRGRVPPERTLAGFFKTQDILLLAAEALAGEIAVRGGDGATAAGHFAQAVKIQDGHWFTEPPPWYYPVRQSLGAALLAAGRPAEAEAVYREDLK